MPVSRLITAAVAASSLVATLALTGCGVVTSTTLTPAPAATITHAGAQGIFMGGQQPVGNIMIQMYQTGTSGYGSAAQALFTPGSTKTTPAGNFNIPSFSCTSGSQLYLVGTQGNPIAGQPVNPNIGLMTWLGLCDNFNPANFINVNELTTVASVYSLSGFMTGIANIGASSSNLTGLNNAANTVTKIVNTTNGTLATPGGGGATTLPSNATLPSTLINTLGDIMEQCINSAGGSASDTTDGVTNGTPCGKLFYLTPNSAGTYPTDTITAMMNLAQHPTVNAAKLNYLRSPSPAFQPALSVNTPPSAFTIGISYTAGLSAPSAVAVDTGGYVWIASQNNNSVVKLNPSGSVSFTATNTITAPAGIAIDSSGNGWVTNSTANTISKITAAGSATSYSGNGLSTPAGIAIDSNNQIWVANTGSGSGVSVFTNTGAAVSGSPFTGGGLTSPASVAVSAK